ncbi:MAG: PAS domain S-box protein [Bacteroidetes bacterium]|nr:PAS domain S-box protein [Bacteroidota bacterium]
MSQILLPLITINVLVSLTDFYTMEFNQYLQAFVGIAFGSAVLIFYKNAWIKKNFVYLHSAFLFCLTLLNFIWFVNQPEDRSVISLMMTVFFSGLLLVKPPITITYFAVFVVSFTTAALLNDPDDVKYGVYVFFYAIVVVIFSYWRENLILENQNAKESYKNLFSDLAEQIYVVSTDLTIIDLNKTALDKISEVGRDELIGKKFHEVFCSRDESDKKQFRIAVEGALKGMRKKFEAQCAVLGSDHFTQKEFTVRKSVYFGSDVLIITIRSVQEQRDFETRLLESKENISRVLENINSFVFNISYRPRGGDHQVNYVSNKVFEVYGIEADEYITLVKSGRLSDIFYPEDRVRTAKLFDEVVQTGHQNQIKFRIVRNGEVRWVEEKIFAKKIDAEGVVQLFGIVTDITEQIEALNSLEQSEKRYRQIFERNLAGVYKTHVDGTIIDANQAFARILGYDSVGELKQQNIKDLYYYKEDRKNYLEKLRSEGFINNSISILRRKDGKRIVLNNNVSIQPDEDGNLNIIEGTLIDITEIEETANALKMSEEKYRLLFEESKEGILLISLKESSPAIIDLNPGAAALLGYEKTKMTGMALEAFTVNPDGLKEQFTENRNNSKKIETEWRFKRSDKSEFVAEISVVAIELGRDKIIQLVIKDISERKHNEEILLESQRSFKNIVDNSPAGILIFTDNELVYTNPQGEHIYNDRLNTKSKHLDAVFPEKLKYLINDLLEEKEGGLNAFTEIELANDKDMRQYSLNAVKTIYNNKKSDLLMLQDVTLQTEYNRQKLRAEIAEDTNKKLQDEIARHKITQSQLLEKTFWLNALFESSYNLFILSLDEKYCISSFNENFRRMIQKSLGVEVKIGDNFLDLFKTEARAREKIEERFARVLNGETLEFISHFEAKTGEVWVESFLNPVKIGDRNVSEISFISHEITEKIEAQRKIKISEANNRAILLALPDILTKVNRNGVFTDFRMSQQNGLDPVLPYLKTPHFIGNKVSDVVKDPVIVAKFLEIVNRVLVTNEFETFTFELNQNDGGRPLYYENRFSKMNENEVIVLARNVTETIEYESMLVESVKEKEILLKEVHHRVKNNLQVINSILNLQSSYVEDPKTLEIINESQNRIRSMSYIHESLYQTKDFSSINFADYITNLVQNLVHSYQLYHDKVELKFNVGPVKLALDQAIPCGLILNELVSNALKYAYPEDEKGQILIEVSENNGKIALGVQDFGVGLPEGFQIENSESLGLSLVYTLVDQLDGELNLKRLGGTKFLITFEKQEV